MMPGRTDRTHGRGRWIAAVAVVVLGLSAVPVAMAAGLGAAPGQRVDLRVLLLAKGGAGAYWQAALRREGVPFDLVDPATAGSVTDASLADYAANRARYQAVIAVDPAASLGLSAAQSAALTQ